MDIHTKDKLTLIAKKAREQPTLKFISLMHLLNAEYLKDCYHLLKRGKAAGIDGRTLESYTEEEINGKIEETIGLMKTKHYTPQPVRRVELAKENGKKRLLGIPTVIDKIIQLGMTRILEAIYEPTFLPLSYGYRPGQGAHEAIKAINHMIMGKKVNWIVEVDIKGFFDHIDHSWMMRCLQERIADPNFLQCINKFLKAGVLNNGVSVPTAEGTPQGGIISPMLANIYLHYVLDLWFEGQEKRTMKGYAQLVRYADDFLFGVQHNTEAKEIRSNLTIRLGKFGLQVAEEKTQVIEFGRFAHQHSRQRGKKPDTFEFLGFTHYCTKTRDGRFMLGVRTSKKQMKRALVAMNTWLKNIRNLIPTETIWGQLKAKLTGHYNYYGISGNFMAINRFYRKTRRLTFKWMNRRSRKKSWNWQGFDTYLKTYPLPTPKLTYAIYNTW